MSEKISDSLFLLGAGCMLGWVLMGVPNIMPWPGVALLFIGLLLERR